MNKNLIIKKNIMSLKKNRRERLRNSFDLYEPNFNIPYLTVKQVKDACNEHRYLILRFWAGHQIGVNGKIARLAKKKKEVKDSENTKFVSFKPCGINEYINHKHPFC
jgi:hypothetical protein